MTWIPTLFLFPIKGKGALLSSINWHRGSQCDAFKLLNNKFKFASKVLELEKEFIQLKQSEFDTFSFELGSDFV